MANRYWVGGTASWDGTIGLKWALTSGGIGGQLAPTSADTVFFDANSGASTVTIGAGTAICATLTMTGFTGTLAFGSNSITVASNGVGVFTGATTYSVTGTPLILLTYAGAAGTSVVTGTVTEANAISFTVSAGSYALTIGGVVKNLTFSGTFTGSLVNSTKTIYGNLTFKTGMTISAGSNITTFAATSGTQTITSAALNLDFPITFSGTATYQLQDALTCGTATARTITLTSGTLDLSSYIFTLYGLFTSTGASTRTIAFGTGQFYLNAPTGNIWTVTGTSLTITGTSPTISATANALTGERTVVHVPTTVSQALSINFNATAGSSNIGFGTGAQVFNNINFTGFSGQIGNAGQSAQATFNIYGNLTMGTGMTCVAGATGHAFRGTGTQVITSNSVLFDQPLTFSGTGTYQLVGDLVCSSATGTTVSSTRSVTLTTGTLNLNNYNLYCGSFSTNNANTRSIAFGTGQIYLTGTAGSIWASSTITGFTVTGTPIANIAFASPTGASRDISSGDMGEGNSISFNITAGSDNITGTLNCNNYNFTGFSGSLSGSKKVYGNLTIPSTVTSIGSQAGAWQFAATSGTKTITTSNKAFDQPLTFTGVGGTWQLVGDLIIGSTRNIAFNSGTINSNGYNISCGTFNYNNANTKGLTLTNSTVTITGGTSASGFVGSNLNTTYNLTGSNIVFTTTGTALFAGGGNSTFSQVTMSGTGTLILGQVSASSTITTLSNTVQPCTISLLSTITQLSVTNFNLSGTAGNLVTLNSTTAGTQANIRKTSGTVNAQYLNIQDSNAAGGATWNALNSINSGNNTGWNFLITNSGNFFMMF